MEKPNTNLVRAQHQWHRMREGEAAGKGHIKRLTNMINIFAMLPWSWMVINMGQNNNNSWSSAHYHLRIQTSNMLTWQLWSFVDNINSISDLTSVLTAKLQAAMRGLQNIGHVLVRLYIAICIAKVCLRQVRAMSSHSQSLTMIGVPWLLLLYKVHVRRYWLRYTTNMTNNDFPTPSLILFLSLASKFCCRLWYHIGKYKVVFCEEKNYRNLS